MSEQSPDSVPVEVASSEKDKSQDKVAYETYRSLLNEAKTAKEKVKVLEAAQKLQTESKMKEQNEWKALAEAKELEAKNLSDKLNGLESTITESIKLNAFQKHLGGKIKSDEYYQFVDTNSIAYNPETKRVDDESVKKVVAEFVKRHASLVEFKTGKMPNEAASNISTKQKNYSEMSTDEIEAELRKLGRI
jgi:hypothetical protein